MNIENIIVHCSDSNFGNVNIIRDWHLARHWRDIGYHFVILNGQVSHDMTVDSADGSIDIGRKLNDDNILNSEEVGAHALGYNRNSIGVCLIGREHFTAAQINSLVVLLLELTEKHKLNSEDVLGHYEVTTGKTCPNIDMKSLRSILKLTQKR